MKRLLSVVLIISLLAMFPPATPAVAEDASAEDYPYDKLEFYSQSIPYSTPSYNALDGVANEEEFWNRIDEIAKVSDYYHSEEWVYVTIVFSYTYSREDHLASHGYSDSSEADPKDVRCYGYCRADYFSDLIKDFSLAEDIKAVDYTENVYTPLASASFKIKKEDISLPQISDILKENAVSKLGFYSLEYRKSSSDSEAPSVFSDVKTNAWYYDYVSEAYSMGLIKGTSDTTFEPNTSLTRAMLVTMIGRFEERLNEKVIESAESVLFSDVKIGTWYSDYVAWAAENEIVNGYPDGTFRPNAPVTREEAVTILGRYYKRNAPAFVVGSPMDRPYYPHTDTAEISDWAMEWVLKGMGIGAVHIEIRDTFGNPSEAPEYYFEPSRSMTRAEAAKVAYIFLSDLEVSIERGYQKPKYDCLTAIR